MMDMSQLLRELDQDGLFDLQNYITHSDLDPREKEILRGEICKQLSERALVRMMEPLVKGFIESRL